MPNAGPAPASATLVELPTLAELPEELIKEVMHQLGADEPASLARLAMAHRRFAAGAEVADAVISMRLPPVPAHVCAASPRALWLHHATGLFPPCFLSFPVDPMTAAT